MLTTLELNNAETVLVRLVQRIDFPKEISSLMRGLPLHSKSKILSLVPFLDYGLLRVGGRLRHSKLEYTGVIARVHKNYR